MIGGLIGTLGAFVVGLAVVLPFAGAYFLVRRLSRFCEGPLAIPAEAPDPPASCGGGDPLLDLAICDWCGAEPAVTFRGTEPHEIWLCDACLVESIDLSLAVGWQYH